MTAEPRRSIAQGAAWSVAARAASQVIQFGASIALARLLAPEAFGLVGMVATVTAFVTLLVDAGLGIAIIQRKALEREQIDGAFAVTVGVGSVVTAALVAFAPAVARFYGDPVLTDLTRVSALVVLASAVGVVPRALLVRRNWLGVVAAIDLGTTAISTALAVTLALWGAGVWALAISGAAAMSAAAALLLVVSGLRPRPHVRWRGAAPLMRVGLNLVAFNAVNYWARTLDNVLIGAWIGEHELGLYLRAYTLMLLPLTELMGALSPSVVPALARLQGDAAAAKTAYLKAVGVNALVAFPAMVGLSLVAGPFVSILYGRAWAGVAPMLRILALVAALQSLSSTVGWVFTSLGRTDLMFRWGILTTIVTVAALAYGAHLGSGVYVAAMYLGANAVLFVPTFIFTGRLVSFRLRELASAIGGTLLATGAMAIVVTACSAVVPPTVGPAVRLMVEVPLGIISFGVASRLLRNRAACDAADLVLEMRPSWRRWAYPVISLLAPQQRPGSQAPVSPGP